jgi:type II secretory pathway pseudopilin PulG
MRITSRHFPNRHVAGFTLVELLLILFILGSLALLTTAIVDGVDEQSRFDQTKSRLEQIRRAVIGDTSRTLNGQPDVRGFVVDMGRLPANLAELVSQGGMPAWGLSSVQTEGVSPVTIELFGGWRGPYLEVPPSFDGAPKIRDGWNNVGGTDDAEKFGWIFTLKKEDGSDTTNPNDAVALQVRSHGSDGVSGVEVDTENPYATDFPISTQNLVEKNDMFIDIDKLRIEFSTQVSNASPSLRLQFYYWENGSVNWVPSASFNADLSSVSVEAEFNPEQVFPAGNYAAVILCDSNNEVYDGDCGSPHQNTKPYYFTLVPRSQLPVIRWNIQ